MNSSISNESNDVITSSLIEIYDWRAIRASKDDKHNLKKISAPAQEYERDLWDLEIVKDHPLEPKSKNFEDIYGYYEVFENNLSRTSSYDDIKYSYQAFKSIY